MAGVALELEGLLRMPKGELAEAHDRLREIQDSLDLGPAAKTIVERLNISERTVKTHLHAVYRKLQVRSRAELILYCKDKGIV